MLLIPLRNNEDRFLLTPDFETVSQVYHHIEIYWYANEFMTNMFFSISCMPFKKVNHSEYSELEELAVHKTLNHD